jgi:hypothetical protein
MQKDLLYNLDVYGRMKCVPMTEGEILLFADVDSPRTFSVYSKF